jgi:serine/threonine protein phosphatase 1
MQEKIQPKRLLAVGDIHGYLDKLTGLMEQVGPTADDRVVFLGDYIDRGPDSRGVIEYLIDFRKRFPQTVFLRGNHEQMLLDAMVEVRSCNVAARSDERKRLRDISAQFASVTENDDDFGRFIDVRNGGQGTLDCYGGWIDGIPHEHESFLESCVFHHREVVAVPDGSGGNRLQEFLFVHAGMHPQIPVEEQDPEDLLWLRDPFIDFPMDFGGAIVVHGHTPEEHTPVFKKHRIGLDNGVYLDSARRQKDCGHLVCCDLISRQHWRQNQALRH